MTATTAIPLAVLTGFAFKRGIKVLRNFWGIAAIISTSFGGFESLNSFDCSVFNFMMLILSFRS